MTAASDWFATNTSSWTDYSVADVQSAKKRSGLTVSLVVPARNEAATVGDVVLRLREVLMSTSTLVDEVIVIDSDSTDGTFEVASDAGARVFRSAEIRPDLGSYPGKGEAMWKSQFVARGDLLVFIDADLVDWHTHFVPGLLGPLVSQPEIVLVKGFYERPMLDGPDSGAFEGGRVTEILARPLLNVLAPDLMGVVQPLAGEWAARRKHLAQLSVPSGYAVEVAALIDTVDLAGLGAIAQVDLGRRGHRHQSLRDLGGMSAEILAAVLRRRAPSRADLPDSRFLRQFEHVGGNILPVDRLVTLVERPPAATV